MDLTSQTEVHDRRGVNSKIVACAWRQVATDSEHCMGLKHGISVKSYKRLLISGSSPFL